jgi:hypothetical protein
MKLIATGALALLIAGCTAAPTASVLEATAEATTTPGVTAAITPEPTVVPSTPEPDPTQTTGRFVAGDTVTVTKDGEPWAEIVVSNVALKSRYGSGYSISRPDKGNIYIQARISYTASTNGVDYNPYDWQVFVAGVAVSNSAFVLDGPKPDLNSGTLPQGRKASGYVVYEVPVNGEVLLSYGANIFSNDAPVFEVVLRSK